jgi:hypothetical protein
MIREEVPKTELTLPFPPIPRPGDDIFWYNDASPLRGKLIGFDKECRPIVISEFENYCRPPSFDHIRLNQHNIRIGPNWERIPAGGKVVRAFPQEIERFDSLLKQNIPPGPQYYELLTELWHRGFEAYLVGGTVRDVIAGIDSFDVDIVTTMPLKKALPLLESMYRYRPSIKFKNGFVRIGGKPASGDPFIDLKCFCRFQPGTDAAIFGSDFSFDVGHRDFACNALYYEPVNKILIDPSGIGIRDAIEKKLSLVCNTGLKSNFNKATIVIRFFKFVCKGFSYDSQTKDLLIRDFIPQLSTMRESLRISYSRTQLLSKHPTARHKSILQLFQDKMQEFGIADIWEKFFEPIKEDILDEK